MMPRNPSAARGNRESARTFPSKTSFRCSISVLTTSTKCYNTVRAVVLCDRQIDSLESSSEKFIK